MSSNRQFAVAVTLAAGFALPLVSVQRAAAGPMPIARRTAGILASDLSLDAVFLVRDLTGDGVADDAGEVTPFFDASNASGLASPTGSVLAMFQSDDGTVYLCDGDTDSVYACKDLNADGDALDAGEARLWFNGFNDLLLPLPTPNGVCQAADGSIFIANAGTTSSPQDGIYRTRDLNGNGNALDMNEQSIFVDENLLMVNNAAPFDCQAIGNTVYFIDPRGNQADAILIGRDINNDGTVDVNELDALYVVGGVVPAPISLALDTDGVSYFVHESSAAQVQTVWKLTDIGNNGEIDELNEGVAVWSEASLPAGSTMSNAFDFTLGPARLAISSNGTDPNDEIIVAEDLNGDGDYNDADGTTIFVQGTAEVVFPENIRALLYYGVPCRADINNSGTVTVQDIFDFLALYFTNDLRADINSSGGVTVQDIFDYLALYFSGC